MISLIAAVSRNGVIGKANDIPWHLPTDLKYFQDTTRNHTVIMGTKTYEGIVETLGKPLPHRRNIVITRDPNYQAAPGVVVAHSIEEALKAANAQEETFVIGGGQIYALALPFADKLYLTEVKADIADGEVFFPEFDHSQWREVSREARTSNDRDEYDFDFVVYERRHD